MDNKLLKNQNGVVAILTLLAVTVFALAIMTTMSVLAASELKMSGSESASEKTFYAAETGINEGLYRVSKNPNPQTFCMAFNGTDVACSVPEKVQVAVSNYPFGPGSLPEDRYKRIIESVATDTSGKVRKLEITATTTSFGGGFNFAVQAGEGGIIMSGNSFVHGDVYSNGSIIPDSSGGGATGGSILPDPTNQFPGNASVAVTGNKLEKITVSADAKAETIIGRDTTFIGKNAYYEFLDGTVYAHGDHGETCNTTADGTYCHRNTPPPPFLESPIKESHILNWIAEIEDPANTKPIMEPSLGDCPSQGPDADGNRTYCVATDDSTDCTLHPDLCLGRQKIYDTTHNHAANLYIDTGKTLHLTGNLYVTGKIFMKNGGKIVIDPSLGAGSVVIIANEIVDIDPQTSFQGSGNVHSYINLISRSDHKTMTDPAVSAWANTNSIIFSAPDGMIYVKNQAYLNVAVAYVVQLANNSHVIFDANLSAFSIPDPDPGPTGAVINTWQEK